MAQQFRKKIDYYYTSIRKTNATTLTKVSLS